MTKPEGFKGILDSLELASKALQEGTRSAAYKNVLDAVEATKKLASSEVDSVQAGVDLGELLGELQSQSHPLRGLFIGREVHDFLHGPRISITLGQWNKLMAIFGLKPILEVNGRPRNFDGSHKSQDR